METSFRGKKLAAWGTLFLVVGALLTYPAISWAQEEVKDDLVDAIEDDEDDILFSGKESDPVTIKKGVIVTGESRSKATINDDVTMEDRAVLKNVTINAKVFGIKIKKGASVTIENVSVKGATDTGIYSEKGGGTLTIRNSLIAKNRKGFYILPGKNVVITGNQVTENAEEGIDIRNDVDGIISGNTVAQNGEGGGEIIVGDSTLTVTKNTFVQNGSSGLALQYYPDNEVGKMEVNFNTFSGNKNYGVICNSPSGGDKPSDFFLNSINLRENSFSANQKGTMRGCGGLRNIIPGQAVEEVIEEEEVPEVPPRPFEEEPSRIKEVRLEQIAGEVMSLEPQIKVERTYGQNLRHYIFQSDDWYFMTQSENLHRLQEQLNAARALPESELLVTLNGLFPDKVRTIQESLDDLTKILETQESWTPWRQFSE